MAQSLLRKISRAARKNPVLWRYGYNWAPSKAYRRQAQGLTSESKRVVEGLDRDGIAITTADDLLGSASLFPELEATVAATENERAETIDGLRRDANDTSTLGQKTFLYSLLGHPVLDPSSVFLRFALQPCVLEIANAYFGMYTRLRAYEVWRNFITAVAPRESQLWHRDREDLQILKVFVYLTDVDEGAGPFNYAPGTHLKGSVHRLPEAFNENGVMRSSDEQMAKVVPAERWIRATGAKGTIVFADTHGYHKGGYARTRERLLYTCMFTSAASESKELLSRPADQPHFPDLARMVALAPARRGLWLTLPSPPKQ